MTDFVTYAAGVLSGMVLTIIIASVYDMGGHQAAAQCAEKHNVYRCERAFVPASTGEEQ